MTGPAMIEKKCARCGKAITVRLADHKRGWGRFCSKSCKATKQTADQIKTARRQRPWQRFNECVTDDDRRDLLRNPRIIRPLYDADGDRDGEEFFAGGEPWDHG